ncbi:MAG: hypothetical protein WAJ93_11545 [Candidatus Nitrosopolaris sp.]
MSIPIFDGDCHKTSSSITQRVSNNYVIDIELFSKIVKESMGAGKNFTFTMTGYHVPGWQLIECKSQ